MAPKDSPAACRNLIDKTYNWMYNSGQTETSRLVLHTDKLSVVSSDVWGVELLAKQTAGSQMVDFSDADLLTFLQDLADKGFPAGGNEVEMSEVHDGIVCSFTEL